MFVRRAGSGTNTPPQIRQHGRACQLVVLPYSDTTMISRLKYHTHGTDNSLFGACSNDVPLRMLLIYCNNNSGREKCQCMSPYESSELANSIEKNLTLFVMLQSHCGGTEETAKPEVFSSREE